MKSADHQTVAGQLYYLVPSLTDIMNKWTRDLFAKPTSDNEKQTIRLLRKVQIATKKLKGSLGYKLCR